MLRILGHVLKTLFWILIGVVLFAFAVFLIGFKADLDYITNLQQALKTSDFNFFWNSATSAVSGKTLTDLLTFKVELLNQKIGIGIILYALPIGVLVGIVWYIVLISKWAVRRKKAKQTKKI
ncbi:hypothetical protein [Mycoplasma putrefaciens]|uniref:Transmembrane protein n=1 Tax=Mycoplasma putrefaciens Mput9231 TaxID=1292033 RepID=M9WD41_9MOLU|nr:hypothetical protein [Mycoplasma putrefaciens]AGJ91097.1 Hypothetical protein MPUT9231_7040 [Mycoplasma putrefaciens Mput9231]